MIKKLRALLDNREISASELTQAYIDRIDKYDGGGVGGLNAYIYVDREGAAKAAAAAQARIDAGEQGLLTGIPFAVNDNICTKDMPTTCASRILDGFYPPYDATVVERLRAAGAILLGKLNMDEFAMGTAALDSYYGRVKNPYDPSRVSGGASGGAAAAVAAGLCTVAVGAGGAGAIGFPAALCGVMGFRPTYGLVSRHGCVAYTSLYDQAGPLAICADDCALLLDAVSGYCPYDMATFGAVMDDRSLAGAVTGAGARVGAGAGTATQGFSDLRGVKLGLIRELFSGEADPQVCETVYEAVKWFERAGAEIVEVSIPMLPYGAAAYCAIACAEASANLARFDGVRYGRRASGADDYYDIVSASRGEGFGREVKRQILFGVCVLSQEYYDKYYRKAVSVADSIRDRYNEVLLGVDTLISPAAQEPAYNAGNPESTSWNNVDICAIGPALAGLPSVSTPCGYISLPNSGRAPVGLAITGRRFDDKFTLGLAGAYEREFSRRAPPVAEGWKGY